jgi:hypothetical protein
MYVRELIPILQLVNFSGLRVIYYFNYWKEIVSVLAIGGRGGRRPPSRDPAAT